MGQSITIFHRTRYSYDRLVVLSPQLVRLRPSGHCRTPIRSYSLRIEPEPHFLNWQFDPFNNHVARVVFPEKVEAFQVTVELGAELVVHNPFDFFLAPEFERLERLPFGYSDSVMRDLKPYLEAEPPGPQLQGRIARASAALNKGCRMVDFLVDLNGSLQSEIAYFTRMEAGVQSCETTLEKASGSCRDSAWLLVQLLRHLGFAARFVSGYLVQLVADEKPLTGPAGPDADFADLHAWAEVYLPGAGWIGMDATSGLLAGEGHIPLACAPRPPEAAPIEGAVEKCETEFGFRMAVRRLSPKPGPKRPFTPEQWDRVLELGRHVDERGTQTGLSLTQGGQPTFVHEEGKDLPEWNTDALGGKKHELGEQWMMRLRQRFAPASMPMHTQGRWYPGESLPRWSLDLFWRKDGEPIWPGQETLAKTEAPAGVTLEQSAGFGSALCENLGLGPRELQAAYEDRLFYHWKEAELPINYEVHHAGLQSDFHRAKLFRLLESGLEKATGWVLPLAREKGGWKTGVWRFRREAMYLTPGDFPMGYRLPHETKDTIYTALCLEVREGHLHVFLPPVEELEDWLQLVEAIRETALARDVPVRLEGYGPPADSRLEKLSVTPDPGVLKVDLHASAGFAELSGKLDTVYEEARACGLIAEKFLVDGKQTGTGGGNHIVVGGATAAESPWVNRPSALASLVLFFQHHPSLSYLFNGLFIGPSGRSPRLDEARGDGLHELEISLEILRRQKEPSLRTVDRALRHLLTDLTGNTQRAELCMDTLHDPSRSTGHLGLVKFCSFEMPPHARLNALQHLLVRALATAIWETPYEGKPVFWGTGLHDKFMLPHHLQADLADVLEFLRRRGFAFDPSWFSSWTDFRFPLYGTVCYGDLHMELRMAHEPRPDLGEEATRPGTPLHVDSSLERLQVKVTGWNRERYRICCNGFPVPLRETDSPGEAVAGVRYRAWQSPECLHPRTGLHAPLTFDVIDLWSGEVLGGCRYHVGDPAGRAYEVHPVNGHEAESRRLARFENIGHTPGRPAAREPRTSTPFPYTLDLRLQGE